MTPSIFTVGLLWILAGVAFVIRGHCRHVADGAMAFVVLVLGWLASLAVPSLESQPSAVEPRIPALEHRSPSLDPSSSTIESAFVGSSLGKTYHRPECFYVTEQMRHLVRFSSQEQAEQAGRKPCTNCITGSDGRLAGR